jgi:hypothetical protein
MNYPDQPLTLIEAIDRARAVGLAIRVMAGFASHTHELLISLDTIDPEPTVSARIDRSSSGILLSEREQSGPERWEYPHSIDEYQDRFFLRICGAGSCFDVPVLPAVIGIVERYGLVEDLALSAPARVDRRTFDRAIASLTRDGRALEAETS